MIVNELLDRPRAQMLWDYNHLKKPLKRADFIFVMCSYNLSVAEYAYIMFRQNMGKFIVLSGGIAHQTDLLRTPWDEAEAVVFKKRLVEIGMPASKIIIEDQAQNCGENISFTKKILEEKYRTNLEGLKTGLIVQKPYMERRAYAAATKQWPEIEWSVTSPNISYEDYIDQFDEERLIHIMVGDTWRIKDYAEKGFQTPQEMPEEVEKSLKELINRGYTQHIRT